MKKAGIIPSSGVPSTLPESNTGEAVAFNIMDTVVRKKDRQWFRIIGHEDVFYELRPLGNDKRIGSSKDIDVHVRDLNKNYEKKDYPEVKVYNINDPEEKKEDKPMAETKVEKKSVEELFSPQKSEPIELGRRAADFHGVTTEYSVKREFLYRIDQILDAVGTNASDGIMEHTGRLIAQIITEGMEREKENGSK